MPFNIVSYLTEYRIDVISDGMSNSTERCIQRTVVFDKMVLDEKEFRPALPIFTLFYLSCSVEVLEGHILSYIKACPFEVLISSHIKVKQLTIFVMKI